MSVKMKETVYNPPAKQILAIPDHYVAIGITHAKATVGVPGNAVLVDGRYIVKAGTIYPANDATAIGVVLNDYDVTDGDKAIAVVVHGFIKTAAIPAVPAAAAKTALKGIQFLPHSSTVFAVSYLTFTKKAYEAGAETAGTKRQYRLRLTTVCCLETALLLRQTGQSQAKQAQKYLLIPLHFQQIKRQSHSHLRQPQPHWLLVTSQLKHLLAAVAVGYDQGDPVTIATVA